MKNLFGAVTLESVAEEVVKKLKARGVEIVSVDLDKSQVVMQRKEGQSVVYLGNVLNDMQRASRPERKGVMARYVAGFLQNEGPPDTYEQAKGRLMPVLRWRADIEARVHELQRMTDQLPDSGEGSTAEKVTEEDRRRSMTMASAAFVGDLMTTLVIDMPDAMAAVSESTLKGWGVSFEEAFEAAVDRLRATTDAAGWKEVVPGLWAGQWGDSYESSRMLLPDLVYRLGISRPVAMVPFRGSILVTSASDEANILNMARFVDSSSSEEKRWVSFLLYRLEGREWLEHAPPAAASALFRNLRLKREQATYDTQKDHLDHLHQQLGLDRFVAKFTLASRGEEEALLCWAVWPQVPETLLPAAEKVVIVAGGDEPGAQITVPLEDVLSIAGQHFERLDMSPTRYLVRGFPSNEEWERLATKQQPL